jgi:hypothetical protein
MTRHQENSTISPVQSTRSLVIAATISPVSLENITPTYFFRQQISARTCNAAQTDVSPDRHQPAESLISTQRFVVIA